MVLAFMGFLPPVGPKNRPKWPQMAIFTHKVPPEASKKLSRSDKNPEIPIVKHWRAQFGGSDPHLQPLYAVLAYNQPPKWPKWPIMAMFTPQYGLKSVLIHLIYFIYATQVSNN